MRNPIIPTTRLRLTINIRTFRKHIFLVFLCPIALLLVSCVTPIPYQYSDWLWSGNHVWMYPGSRLPPTQVALLKSGPYEIYIRAVDGKLLLKQTSNPNVHGNFSGSPIEETKGRWTFYVHRVCIELLPGRHTLSIHYSGSYASMYYGKCLEITFNAEAGKTYKIKPSFGKARQIGFYRGYPEYETPWTASVEEVGKSSK